jgi:hypothetical protein
LSLDSRFFFLEKFLKKLLGRNDVEDALKRLDKLTQEEAKMATAEVLKITRGMDSNVKVMDTNLKVLIDGAQSRFLYSYRSSWSISPDGKEARSIMQQEKRLSFFNLTTVLLEAQPWS